MTKLYQMFVGTILCPMLCVSIVTGSMVSLLSSRSWGWDLADELTGDREIYETYHPLCQNLGTLNPDANNHFMPFPNPIFNTGLREAFQLRVFLKGRELVRVLESEGYEKAMQDCFHDDEKSKTLFTTELIRQDIGGKFSGGAFWAGSVLVTGRIMSILLEAIAKRGKWWKRGAYGFVGVTLFVGAVSALIEVYQRLHPEQRRKEQEKAQIMSVVVLLDQQIGMLEADLAAHPNAKPADIERHKTVIQKMREQRVELVQELAALEHPNSPEAEPKTTVTDPKSPTADPKAPKLQVNLLWNGQITSEPQAATNAPVK
ncbi:MAG: hypothetical protein C5B49_16395 [Bdellovibrio sp.]|nr:MAG: hypothetical protein C5B49_16395 [Bdellovibrio sp.]